MSHCANREFRPWRVGDYPDIIEGYLGCPLSCAGSNLRPWGNCEKSPLLPVAIRTFVRRDLRIVGEADNEC